MTFDRYHVCNQFRCEFTPYTDWLRSCTILKENFRLRQSNWINYNNKLFIQVIISNLI